MYVSETYYEYALDDNWSCVFCKPAANEKGLWKQTGLRQKPELLSFGVAHNDRFKEPAFKEQIVSCE